MLDARILTYGIKKLHFVAAGDHVKFNFPMASTVTMLTWGMLRYKAAYQSAKEYDNALDSIRWPFDYFIKCHTKPDELYMQVSNLKCVQRSMDFTQTLS